MNKPGVETAQRDLVKRLMDENYSMNKTNPGMQRKLVGLDKTNNMFQLKHTQGEGAHLKPMTNYSDKMKRESAFNVNTVKSVNSSSVI
jgi:hypothetical protein